MKRTLTEQKVLKKLGISDFRHMTKDKIVKFASMLPYMDPEVAKKALDQFPAFKELVSQLVVEYKAIVEKVLAENTASQDAFYTACNSILESLQRELQSDDLTQEEKDRIENKMLEVAKLIGEKDSENKRFLVKLIAIASFAVVGIVGTAASLLGSNSQASGMDDAFGNLEG